MRKPANLAKSSFTLVETLLALVILSVIISGYNQFITNPLKQQTYQELQNSHNNFLRTTTIINSEYFSFAN